MAAMRGSAALISSGGMAEMEFFTGGFLPERSWAAVWSSMPTPMISIPARRGTAVPRSPAAGSSETASLVQRDFLDDALGLAALLLLVWFLLFGAVRLGKQGGPAADILALLHIVP